MKLKYFKLVDDTGRKVTVITADKKSAVKSWEYANPGVKVVSVKEDITIDRLKAAMGENAQAVPA